MDIDDEEFRRLVAPLDPTMGEHPPGPGSDRYRTILETAMQTHTDGHSDYATGADTHPERSRGRRRLRIAAAGTAAAAVVVAIGALAIHSMNPPSVQGVVSEAADALTDVRSLEVNLTTTSPDRNSTSRLLVDGDNFELTSQGTYAGAHTESSTMTVVDGTRYETSGGTTTRQPAVADELPAPFGPSSRAVVAAALTGATVTDAGSQMVGSVEATRYDIEMTAESTAALSALTPNELAWFELEYPDQVDSISIWISDDLIRQIEIVQDGATVQATYTNFNGDITIEAPPGPFSDNSGG